MTDPAESPTITEADLEGLNRRALLRTLEAARKVSTVMLVVAGLLLLAWLWTLLRSQGVIPEPDDDGFTPFFVGEDLSVRARFDFLANTLYSLGTAALVTGLGVGLRVLCDLSMLRAGGSLTGWELGEPLHPDPADLGS